jgi:hypothetical protein
MVARASRQINGQWWQSTDAAISNCKKLKERLWTSTPDNASGIEIPSLVGRRSFKYFQMG